MSENDKLRWLRERVNLEVHATNGIPGRTGWNGAMSLMRDEIDRLLAEPEEPTVDLVAQERAELVRRVGSDCCRGTDPACGGGCLFERAVRKLDLPNPEAVPQEPQEQPGDKVLRVLVDNYEAARDTTDMQTTEFHALVELCRRALAKGGKNHD